jgi:two-component system sensor histidine kinase PilS (NtrC family)
MGRELAESQFDNLSRLQLFRTVTATALLLPVLYYQWLFGSEGSLAPVYTIIAALYGASLLQVLVRRGLPDWRGHVTFQITADVVLATAAIYVMGGVRSPLVLLYLLIAFAAGVMTSRPTALALACLCGVFFALVAHLGLAGWLPLMANPFSGSPNPMSPPELYLRIFMVLLSSCTVAAVTSRYIDRLESTRQALQQERSALEALQRLNQQLLAGMSSGLIAVDTDGAVVACNRAAERITERAEAELVGAPAADVFGFDAVEYADLAERVRGRQIYRTERRVPLPDGGVRNIGMSVTRVEDAAAATDVSVEAAPPPAADGPWAVRGDGPIVGGYIFMFQDLTDIKRLERVFWMRERMALLGEMAGSLAHEIRNPLASISGSLQILRRDGVAADPGRADRLMEIVTTESERLSRIIEDFLDYARPEKLEAVETDLVELARDTVELLGNSTELHPEHTLEVVATATSVPALVDGARVRQVFWNLSRNAASAMPEGGRLRIRLERTSTGAEVAFEDEGVGMTPEQVDKIFRPFVSEKGTGLGLAIVYRLMELHGARVEVESEPGRGTTFRLLFNDDNVPRPGDPVVVVEAGTERATREFDELKRSVQSE